MTNPTVDSKNRYPADPDHLLTLLKGPQRYAEAACDAIAAKKGRAFHKLVTEYLRSAMDLFDEDSVINIVHYWLAVRQLPLDPKKIDPQVFDRFNLEYRERIHDLAFVHRRLGFQ